MKHEKIFKRRDGSQVKIEVRLSTTRYNLLQYTFSVFTKASTRKRKWWLAHEDSWKFRELSMEDRQSHRKTEYLQYCTEEEVYLVCHELHQQLTPEILGIMAR